MSEENHQRHHHHGLFHRHKEEEENIPSETTPYSESGFSKNSTYSSDLSENKTASYGGGYGESNKADEYDGGDYGKLEDIIIYNNN